MTIWVLDAMPHYPGEIEYSDKYNDDSYEYRHVILTTPQRSSTPTSTTTATTNTGW